MNDLSSSSIDAELFADALHTAELTEYVFVHKDSHAPITPIAPLYGYLGISADASKRYSFATARPIYAITNERRASFASLLEDMALMRERCAGRLREDMRTYADSGNIHAWRGARKRLQREIREQYLLEDRAQDIRRSLRPYLRMEE